MTSIDDAPKKTLSPDGLPIAILPQVERSHLEELFDPPKTPMPKPGARTLAVLSVIILGFTSFSLYPRAPNNVFYVVMPFGQGIADPSDIEMIHIAAVPILAQAAREQGYDVEQIPLWVEAFCPKASYSCKARLGGFLGADFLLGSYGGFSEKYDEWSWNLSFTPAESTTGRGLTPRAPARDELIEQIRSGAPNLFAAMRADSTRASKVH